MAGTTETPAPGAASRSDPQAGSRHGGAAGNPLRLVLTVILAGLALRVVTAAVVGLSVDESYAVSVSRVLSLSYFDHPPLSFWIPGFLARLTGSESALLLRLPFILLFAGTTWLMYRVTARPFGARAGAWAALALNVAPVFSLTTGGWILPDGPLMFFLLAGALCLEPVLLDGDVPHATAWWLAAGACAGLAMLSKYHGIFLPAGTLLFLLTRRGSRRWLRRPAPYLSAALAIAITLPVLVWNARHGWISFRFQGGRGVPVPGIHPEAFVRSIGGQMLYVLPWIWLPLVVLGVRALRHGPAEPKGWFFLCLAAGPIVFFTLPSLGGRAGLPHWEAPGYLMLFPLLGAELDRRVAAGSRAARRWLAGSTIAYVALIAVAVSQGATGWLSRAVPAPFRHGDPTWEVVDWSELRGALARRGLLDGAGTAAPFVAATRWMDAGKTAYALGPAVPVLCLCTHPHHFYFVQPERRFVGRDAVIVEPPDAGPDAVRGLAPYFRSIERLGPVAIHRAGHPEFTLPLYLGRDLLRPVPADLAR